MRDRIFSSLKNIFKYLGSHLNKINLPFLLLILMIPLRFINLGYSEYICDESVALNYLRTNGTFYSYDFLLSQHKGPVQYLLGGMTFLITNNVFNEYVYRIPFAVANILSVVVLYFFVKNVTKSKLAGFTSALLFGLNGMTVVFGRIFQYQSFNILFSFLSLYFYSNVNDLDPREDEKKLIKNSVIGTIFFCLSILSHWDAVFILPYVLYVVLNKVIFQKELPKKLKYKFIFLNLMVLLILAALYLFPYAQTYLDSYENQAYFKNRVNPEKIDLDKFVDRVKFLLFRLKIYNPILTIELFFSFFLLSFLYIKKLWLYMIWFVAEFLIFVLVFTNSGTHIYNMYIPLSIAGGFLVDRIYSFITKQKGTFKTLLIPLLSVPYLFIFGFFYYQTYALFINHSPEYPWHSKKILGYKIGDFSLEEQSKYMRNNKIGFPLRREWQKIEEVMSKYEIENGLDVGSVKIETNENVCPVNFYTGRDISSSGDRFVLAIKYPLSLVNDYKNFYKVENKEILEVLKNAEGDTVAFVYIAD